MKKTIILIFAILPSLMLAQKKDIQKVNFEVNGVCGMCKSRIEKAAFALKGVKTARWDIQSHQFYLLYDANKIALKEVQQAIANVGHDTPLFKANDKVYENLPLCCLYEREEEKEQ